MSAAMTRLPRFLSSLLLIAALGCGCTPEFDLVIEGGTVYDGTGADPVIADIGIVADSIVAIGDLDDRSAATRVDATGLAVAPGFINMLSWADETVIQDGRGLSDLMQGVTLEVFGEGWSNGPLTDSMAAEIEAGQERIKYDVSWRTLGEYLQFLETRGVSPNVASFVGATTVRIHELGYEDRAPTPEELERMKELVRAAMEEGAMGVGSSLIYAPAFFASTEELVALASVAAEYDGMYIAHIRNEADGLEAAIEEHLRITREAGIRSEIYHLKASGRQNWHKAAGVLDTLEAARAAGLEVSADMYTYAASSTGLDAAMPVWVQEGGFAAWRDRLMRPEMRARVVKEMRSATGGINRLNEPGTQSAMIVGVRQDSLRHLVGRSIADVAAERGITPEELAIDLVIADSSRIQMVYFAMSEDNVRRQVATPWITFGSDGGAPAPEEPFTATSTHPRAYGNFARLLGRYVRDEGLIPMQQAIHRLTGLPASRLRIERRGTLKAGAFADIVVFDPATIRDLATFDRPHQLAEGVRHVWVNGTRVVSDGNHTGTKPGRFVRRSDARP